MDIRDDLDIEWEGIREEEDYRDAPASKYHLQQSPKYPIDWVVGGVEEDGLLLQPQVLLLQPELLQLLNSEERTRALYIKLIHEDDRDRQTDKAHNDSQHVPKT